MRQELYQKKALRFNPPTDRFDDGAGVLAPNSPHRAAVTPAKRGKGAQPRASEEGQERTPTQRRAAMTWAQRLKRVFGIDMEICPACGGALRVIACIEDPAVIACSTEPSPSPKSRADPDRRRRAALGLKLGTGRKIALACGNTVARELRIGVGIASKVRLTAA